jgi:hypothetical protein
MNEGGDKRTPTAKVDVARREQQIVALRLRGIPVFEVAEVLGISRRAVLAAFSKALHRNTEDALDAWHRIELGKLQQEETNIWRLMDLPQNKDDWKAIAGLEDRLLRIHIRRAKLLGLDAPAKLDISALYGTGTDVMSAERLENQRAWQSLPVEEQIRIYDMLYAAKKSLSGR